MYAKIENGKIVFASNEIKTIDKLIINPKRQDYLDNGYKLVEETPKPNENCYFGYEIKNNKVVKVWYELTDNRTYAQKVVELIREKYSIDDELAILRQRDTKDNEFNEYNEFVENCKIKARGE